MQIKGTSSQERQEDRLSKGIVGERGGSLWRGNALLILGPLHRLPRVNSFAATLKYICHSVGPFEERLRRAVPNEEKVIFRKMKKCLLHQNLFRYYCKITIIMRRDHQRTFRFLVEKEILIQRLLTHRWGAQDFIDQLLLPLRFCEIINCPALQAHSYPGIVSKQQEMWIRWSEICVRISSRYSSNVIEGWGETLINKRVCLFMLFV